MQRAAVRLHAVLALVLLCHALLLAQTPTPTPIDATEVYIVRQGDSLASISRIFRVPVQQIIETNNLPRGIPIRPGQELIIPLPPDDPALTVPWTLYTVQRGDTLARLADKFNTTVDLLIALNRLTKPNELTIGAQLRVPQTETTPSPAPTARPSLTPTPTPQPRIERGLEVFLRGQSAEQLLQWVQELDIDWVKIVVNWRELEPEPDLIDWQMLDTTIEGLHRQNRRIMLTLTGAPNWARPSATSYVLSLSQYGPPDSVDTYAHFAARTANRYRGRVQAYEIWLEPNLRRSWLDAGSTSRDTTRLSRISYLPLLSAAAEAIRSVDPTAQIVSAGLAPTGLTSPQNSIADRLFLRTLLDGGLLELVDAVGVQPDGFANPPEARCCAMTEGVLTHFEQPEFYFFETLSAYRQLVDTAGGEDVPLWVTRFGWGSAQINTIAAPNMIENPFFTYNTPQEQLDFTRRAFRVAAQFNHVSPMILYNLNGCPARLPEACFYSLLQVDGRPNPTYDLFRRP